MDTRLPPALKPADLRPRSRDGASRAHGAGASNGIYQVWWGFPGDSEGKESAYKAGDPGLIPGLKRSPGEGNGNPLQCSCLEHSMDRGAWRAIVHGVTKSQA